MRTLRFPLIILALVGLIAVSGCGGSDSSSDSGALSTDEYATQLRQVFLDFSQAGADLQGKEPATQEEAKAQIDQIESVLQTATTALNGIEPPEEAKDAHEQIVAAFEDFSSKISDVGADASSGSVSANQAKSELKQPLEDFQSQLSDADQALKTAGIDLDAAGDTTDSTTSTG